MNSSGKKQLYSASTCNQSATSSANANQTPYSDVVLKRRFFNRVLEFSKADKNQRRSFTFGLGPRDLKNFDPGYSKLTFKLRQKFFYFGESFSGLVFLYSALLNSSIVLVCNAAVAGPQLG